MFFTPHGFQQEIGTMINGFMLHEMASAPAASVEILNAVQKAWGFVPNLHRVLAESPAALDPVPMSRSLLHQALTLA